MALEEKVGLHFLEKKKMPALARQQHNRIGLVLHKGNAALEPLRRCYALHIACVSFLVGCTQALT